MATIRKRGPYQFQALVRRKGHPKQIQTFESKAEAEEWARSIEAQIDDGSFRDRRLMAKTTLREALQRYAELVTVNKCEPEKELARIETFKQLPMASKSMDELRADDFRQYRDERLKKVSGTAVKLEMAIFSHLYTIAIKEWSWPLTHEVKNVRKPKANQARSRRLTEEEYERLFVAIHRPAARSTRIWLDAAIRLALETGMRPGEVLKAKWSHVDFKKRILVLTHTKNKETRRIPLSHKAVELLKSLERVDEFIIAGFHDVNGMGDALRKACQAADIKDFRFQDLRHEVASRWAPHLTLPVLAKLMGWKNHQMAMRYYNPTDEDQVNHIDRVNQATQKQRNRHETEAQVVHASNVSEPASPAMDIPVSSISMGGPTVSNCIPIVQLPAVSYSVSGYVLHGTPERPRDRATSS